MKGKTMALNLTLLSRTAAVLLLACAPLPAPADDLGLPALPPTGATPPSAASAPATAEVDAAKMQAQMKDLLDQEQSIKDSESTLNSAIDRLLTATGVHFGGEAVMESDDMLVLQYDPKSLAAQASAGGAQGLQYNLQGGQNIERVWPTIGYFDLEITARPRPELSADVVYRMEKVFGGFWGALDISGVRWFNVHGDTPVGFDIGMFHYQNTPLTFWVPQDEYAFEPQVLSMKRVEGREEAQIQDQSFPLQGGRLDTTLLLFSHLDLDLNVLGLRTAIAGNKNSPLAFATTFPYDQYLFGGTARFSGEHAKAFSLGFSYFQIQESIDTAEQSSSIPQQYSDVVGSDFKLSMASDRLVLHGEGAYSNYTPAYGTPEVVSWTAGGAGNVFLDLKTDSTKLSLHGLYVDQQYINYAAQTRDEDTLHDFTTFMPTGNNLHNPHDGSYTLVDQSNLFFSTYNNVIFATNQGPNGGLIINNISGVPGGNGSQPGGIYLSPSPLNLSLPEGYATPNRAGFGGDYSGKYIGGGFLLPRVFGGVYSEPEISYAVPGVVGRREFERGGAGVSFDLAGLNLIPMKLSAGVVVEDDHSNSFVAYTSTRIGYDLDWEAFKGVHVMAGFEHVDLNGGEFWNYGTGPVFEWQNYTYDDYVAGLNWKFSKSTTAYLTYSFNQFNNIDYNNTALAQSHPNLYIDIYSADTQTQEIEAKLRMRF